MQSKFLPVLLPMFFTFAVHAESPKQKQTVKAPELSDREKAGLRGSVRSCTEEIVSSATTLSDGTHIPETQSSFTTE